MTAFAPPVLLGSQRPRVSSDPEGAVASSGQEAADLAASIGLHLDPWQSHILDVALGERADGTWAAFEVAAIVSRQNGKGAVIEARELAGLFLLGERLILHSAHQFRTSLEAFRRMETLLEGSDLAREIKRIRRTTGEESIELRSGARLQYIARSGGAGRGFSGDCVILDEAFNLGGEAMSALLPTLSARPNPQVWYTSSAGMSSSEQLARVRARALAGGSPRLAYFEWSAPDDAGLDDPAAWAQANPALGLRIDADFIAAEREAMPDVEFARERLGIWQAPKASQAIDPAVWTSLIGPTPPQGRDVVFALDVAPDHSSATVAAAWSTPDGTWLQLADHRPGVDWVVARCGELLERWGGTVLVEQTGTAGFLLPRLNGTEPVSRRFYADACSSLDAAVSSRSVRHGNQRELNDAVAAARWSSSGEAGQRVLSRKDPRVSPLVAAALALHGLQAVPVRGARFASF